jgi:hypothetical protein
MAHYEVVGYKGLAGSDYMSADSLALAQEMLVEMKIREPSYETVFVRQYRKDRLRGETFRVLHKLTWKRQS